MGKRRHYSITNYLPLGDCAAVDRENERAGVAHEWLKESYLQPALKEKGASRDDTILKDEAFVADDHKEKGNGHMSNKEYKLALLQYNQAIELSPSGKSTYIYYSNRAAAFCYLGEYDAAVGDCRKSIQLNPTYGKAHTRLGLCLFSQEDYHGAISAYAKALDLDPTDEATARYMAKAQERLAAQRQDECIEVKPPKAAHFACGVGSGCWDPVGESQSFDLSTTNIQD